MAERQTKFNPALRHVVKLAREAGFSPLTRRQLFSRQELPPKRARLDFLYKGTEVGFAEVMAEVNSNGNLKRTLFESLNFQGVPKINVSDIQTLAERLRCVRENLEARPLASHSEICWVELTKAEIRSYNLAVKFFEEWFYEGRWAKLSKSRSYARENAWADFFAPAVLINTMAKIKEQAQHAELESFDQHRLLKFVQDVVKVKRAIIGHNHESLAAFVRSKDWLVNSLNGVGNIPNNEPRDLYMVKDILIAGEFARRDYCKAQVRSQVYAFNPQSMTKDLDGNNLADNGLLALGKVGFQNGNSDFIYSMHYLRPTLPFSRVAFEYLRQKNCKH